MKTTGKGKGKRVEERERERERERVRRIKESPDIIIHYSDANEVLVV